MRRIKRIVTVTFEYENAGEALRHRRIMADDGWDAREIGDEGVWVTEYTLDLAEEE